MTDPLDSLRPPRRPLIDGGDLRAVTRGRRVLHRRRVAAGGVAGAGLLAVGVVAALDRPASGHDSIRFLDPSGSPEPTATASGAPSQPPGPLPTVLPTAVGLPPLPGQSGSPEPTPSPVEATPAPRGRYVGPEPAQADGGPVVTRTEVTDRTFCAYGSQQPVGYSGWCSAVTGPQTVTAGTSSVYSLKLCRRPDVSAMTLHFDSRREFSMYVVGTDAADRQEFVWDAWKSADLAPDAHEMTIVPGDCVTWTTTWGGQDDAGYAVPEPWSYELYGLPAANEFIGDNSDERALPATVFSIEVKWE